MEDFLSMMSLNCDQDGFYSNGLQTHKVSYELFALNRRRLCERLRTVGQVKNNAVIFLQGGNLQNLYDTDVEYVFRQEQYFFWAFGVHEDGCYAAIHVPSNDAYLFVPRQSEDLQMWVGKLPTLDQFRQKYRVKSVYYNDETHRRSNMKLSTSWCYCYGFIVQQPTRLERAAALEQIEMNHSKLAEVLKSLSPDVLLTLSGINSDSGIPFKEAFFAGIEQFVVADSILYHHMAECRVIKTELEKEVMRYVARVSSNAHKAVMKIVQPDMYEYQCEAMFLHHVYHSGGCRHVAYNCICGVGESGSILHYGHAGRPNNKAIRNGEMCLFDMGAEYCGYASDITVSFPVNGKFTEDQKSIYNAVLAANLVVQKSAKPGVSWPDMHILANRVLLEELKKIGIVQGDVDEMLEAGVAAIFQPHGLGHFLGLAVHDVGGYLKGMPDRRKEPGLRYLRTARILQAGMALTIEPGCYFIDFILDKALADPNQRKYLNEAVLNRFRNFGGVRIEDDIFITETGIENYTTVPRTVEEIENWMNSPMKVLQGDCPQNEN